MAKNKTESAPDPLVLEAFKLDPRLVVIEAGAGSGKTYNLVRIVRKMSEEGRDISRLLLVTFTNAAALEMRQRMRDLLEKEFEAALIKKPEGGALQQLAAIQQLAAMQITTIHSFCHRAYAEYGPIVGFPTIEGTPKESSQLASEIGEDFWRKKSRESHPPEVSLKEIIMVWQSARSWKLQDCATSSANEWQNSRPPAACLPSTPSFRTSSTPSGIRHVERPYVMRFVTTSTRA
jgi:ATP-dependent exoDNAse (exonuclease V) beta subunit